MERLDGQDYKQAAQLLTSWRRPVLLSHAKPDGDAIGSLFAMNLLLRTKGIDATPLLFEKLPARFANLAGAHPFAVGNATTAASVLGRADGILVVDTCSYSQLEPVADWLRNNSLPKLVIDHHSTRDNLTPNLLIDDTAAATCLILYEFAQAVAWPVDAATASNLFVGIATDTGWFRHSNTDARAMHVAADLMACGVKAYELFEALYQQDSASRVHLLAEALQSLELHSAEKIALMCLPRDAFNRAQATPADTEDVVNEPLRIATVVVSVLLVEQEDGQIRINLRSKAPDPSGTRPNVDVAQIAKGFGGGGHRHAAGARSKEGVNDAREKVLASLNAVLSTID